jgi:predicted nucleotidyltransferase
MTDFRALLSALTAHDVKFVIVGGAAATAQGAARLTQDLDVVYDRDPENIRRLAASLAPHRPYLRGAPPGLPFVWDERTIAQGLNFTLTTAFGDLDLFGEITGGGTYATLLPHAVEIDLFGRRCQCLGIDKLIDVKRAAGRPKDLEAIAELETIRDAMKAKPG